MTSVFLSIYCCLFLTLLSSVIILVAEASPCSGSNKTTYLRSEATRLMEFATHTVKDVTLNICADACTNEDQGHRCSSFEYNSATRECAIHEEDGQPLGPSVLAKSNEKTLSFFQQVCVEEEYLCASPYAFERYPQSVLQGFALTVVPTDGLSECLSLCLSQQSTLSSACSSFMYFYETGECIMNRVTKEHYPHLFKSQVQETLVDYFENTCTDVSCPSIHWLRSEDYQLSADKDVIIESMSIEECKALCAANLIGQDRFPCHSFVFTSSKQECHLSADIASFSSTNSSTSNFNLNPINNGEYFQKICLNSTVSCLDASYEHVKGRKMDTQPYKVLPLVSLHLCLSVCIDEGANCASASYNYYKNECHLSEFSQFSRPDNFKPHSDCDYFDKICDTIAAPPTPPSSDKHKVVAQAAPNRPADDLRDIDLLQEQISSSSREDHESVGQTEAEAEETVIDDEENFREQSQNPVKAHLSSECRMSGVTVDVTFAQNTSGTIYIKDHFATCRAEFSNSDHAVLHIPFPTADEEDPRCPGLETAPNLWRFTVVVQRNEMQSPSLLTSTDRVFNISCDYTELIEKISDPGTRPVFDDPSATTPDAGELSSEKIRMEILRDGRPVTIVPLGDVVELRWTVIHPDSGLGFFVNECVAQRVGGSEPAPEPLKLIHAGCPEGKVKNRLMDSVIEALPQNAYSTRMKVFRFDGSRRVRIKCTIDVCIDECKPVICDELSNGSGQSYGRKKRNSNRPLPQFNVKMPPSDKQRIVSGTLTVVDVDDVQTVSNHKTTTRKNKPRPEFSSLLTTSSDKICFYRYQLAACGSIMACMVIACLFLIAFVCHRRCISRIADDPSCASSLSGLSYPSEYNSSSYQRPSSCGTQRLYQRPRLHE